jgi:hypothetical protein
MNLSVKKIGVSPCISISIEMAEQLHRSSIDLGDETACLHCLMNTGNRYRWSVVRIHLDAAIDEARLMRVSDAIASV